MPLIGFGLAACLALISDRAGDDDVDILIEADGELTVEYRSSDNN